MSQFQVKVKSNFNSKSKKVEKGLEVTVLSNETSAPNLMSRGKKEIKNAFKNNFGVDIEDMYISSSYFEIKKLN
jgi:hypothetical protein